MTDTGRRSDPSDWKWDIKCYGHNKGKGMHINVTIKFIKFRTPAKKIRKECLDNPCILDTNNIYFKMYGLFDQVT